LPVPVFRSKATELPGGEIVIFFVHKKRSCSSKEMHRRS